MLFTRHAYERSSRKIRRIFVWPELTLERLVWNQNNSKTVIFHDGLERPSVCTRESRCRLRSENDRVRPVSIWFMILKWTRNQKYTIGCRYGSTCEPFFRIFVLFSAHYTCTQTARQHIFNSFRTGFGVFPSYESNDCTFFYYTNDVCLTCKRCGFELGEKPSGGLVRVTVST